MAKARKKKSRITWISNLSRNSRLVLSALLFAAVGTVLLTYTQAAPSQVAVRAPYGTGVPIPSSGVYVGMSSNGDNFTTPGCTNAADQIAFMECKVKWAGSQQRLNVPTNFNFSTEHFFKDCTKPLGSAVSSSAKAPGRKMLIINMKCGKWADMMNGNATLVNGVKARVAEAKALNFPVIFSFHHEPENDSCGSSSYYGTPDEYRAAYRKFVDVMRTEAARVDAKNIASGWTIMGFTFSRMETAAFTSCSGLNAKSDPIRNPDNWYPGDDAVDWIVNDIYDSGGNKTFQQMVEAVYPWTNTCRDSRPTVNYNCTSAKFKKPLGWAEYGFNSTATTPQQRASQFDEHVRLLPSYPKMRALSYWNSNRFQDATGDGGNFLIDWPTSDANRTVLKAYARVAFNPYVANITFGPTLDTTAPVASASVPSTVPSGRVTVQGSATDNLRVTSLEVKIDNVVYASGNTDRISFIWDTTKVASGAHTITVTAKDAAGNTNVKTTNVTK